MTTNDSMVCPICGTAIVPVPAADGLGCYRPAVDVADLQRQLAEARGELATVLAGADADAVLLGNLNRRCQSQQRMIAHLRDRLAKCQEHNRRLVQEAREAYRHVDSIIRRCGEEVAETERELAECQAQAAEWRAIESKAQELVQARDDKLAEFQALKREIIDRTGIGSESSSRLIDMVRQLLDRYEECQAQAAAMRRELDNWAGPLREVLCGTFDLADEPLARLDMQAAIMREALEAQGRLDDECETCAQAFDCPCFSPADGAECKLWAEVQAKKDAALAGDAGRAMVERVQKAEALAEEIKRIKIAWGRAMSVLRFFGSGVGMPDCSTCPDPDCDDGPCEEMETALDVMRGEWDAVEEDPDGVAAWEKWRQLEAVAKAAIAWVNACEACDNEPSELNEDIAGDAAGALEAAARRLRDGTKVEAAVDADEPTVAPPNTGWQQDYGRGVEEKES